MSRIRRRTLLKGLAAGAAASLLPRAAFGANEKLRLGLIGLRWRGSELLGHMLALSDARVAAICDVDPAFVAQHEKTVATSGQKATSYLDVRRLIDDKSIDALVIAAPNHWHALMTVLACQAGKDVYVEKPIAHDVWEGRQMLAAAAKYGRVVQVGSQNRSDPVYRQVREFLRRKPLGEITAVRSVWYRRREPIGKRDPWTPADLNYDLWCGPAPVEPLRRTQLHYDWHWMWATGNGDLSNLGFHQLDICRWIMGYEGLPKRVLSVGGRYVWDDAGETPNTELAVLDYDPLPLVFEVRNLTSCAGEKAMDKFRGEISPVVFDCAGGYVLAIRGKGFAYDRRGEVVEQFAGDQGATHMANFVEACRRGPPPPRGGEGLGVSDSPLAPRARGVGVRGDAFLAAPLDEGFISTTACLMGNISYRLGKGASVAEIRKSLPAHGGVQEMFDGMTAHLKAHEIDLDKQRLTLGPWLTLATSADRFTAVEGDGSRATVVAANELLRCPRRKQYALPELA